MKTIFKTFILFIVITTISSCSEDDNSIIVNEDISISPDIGPKNTVVSIAGIAFGTDITKVKVFFNDKEATVQSVTDTQIEAIVPVKAGTGLVNVVIDGAENFGPEFTYTLTGTVSTFAGIFGASGAGYVDGDVSIAKFNKPSIAIDPQGNLLIVDKNNRKIRKITLDGVVSTIAGSTQGFEDGEGVNAKFWNPDAITVDKNGNAYVIDDDRIRKITPNGIVSTFVGSTNGFADGTGTNAKFNNAKGLAADALGNLYVADFSNHRIRKITLNGTVSTLAGSTNGFADGEGSNAQFSYPRDVAVDTDGNIYVADYGNYRIRKITPNGEVSTIAGSNIQGYGEGTGSNARFKTPFGITVDADKNVYVSDVENYAIRKITPNEVVSTLAGGSFGTNNGDGFEAQFSSPASIAIDTQGNIYVAETDVNVIRKIIQE